MRQLRNLNPLVSSISHARHYKWSIGKNRIEQGTCDVMHVSLCEYESQILWFMFTVVFRNRLYMCRI
jgi:hypothetical protein